jgi:hypothetical protein
MTENNAIENARTNIGGYRPGDEMDGHVLGEDLQWHRIQPQGGKKDLAWGIFGLIAIIGVVVGIIWLIASALIDSPTEKEHKAAEAQATAIITDCANIVQPQNWPRMSASEEARMLACSLRQTDDPAVIAEIHAYGMDGK